jgi:hypothetical protein
VIELIFLCTNFIFSPILGLVYNPCLFTVLWSVGYLVLRRYSHRKAIAFRLTYLIVAIVGSVYAWQAIAQSPEPTGHGWLVRMDPDCLAESLPIYRKSKKVEGLIARWYHTAPGARSQLEQEIADQGTEALPYLTTYPCREELHAWVPTHELLLPLMTVKAYSTLPEVIYRIHSPTVEVELRKLLKTGYAPYAALALMRMTRRLDNDIYRSLRDRGDFAVRSDTLDALQASQRDVQIAVCIDVLKDKKTVLREAEYEWDEHLRPEFDRFLTISASLNDPTSATLLHDLKEQLEKDISTLGTSDALAKQQKANAEHSFSILSNLLLKTLGHS